MVVVGASVGSGAEVVLGGTVVFGAWSVEAVVEVVDGSPSGSVVDVVSPQAAKRRAVAQSSVLVVIANYAAVRAGVIVLSRQSEILSATSVPSNSIDCKTLSCGMLPTLM